MSLIARGKKDRWEEVEEGDYIDVGLTIEDKKLESSCLNFGTNLGFRV